MGMTWLFCTNCGHKVFVTRTVPAGESIKCPKCGWLNEAEGRSPAKDSRSGLVTLTAGAGEARPDPGSERAEPKPGDDGVGGSAVSGLSKYGYERPVSHAALEEPTRARGPIWDEIIGRPIRTVACLAALVAAVAGLWWVVSRGPSGWERDNRDRILSLSREAGALRAEQNFAEAIDRYQQLLDLVGDREIQGRHLGQVVRAARRDLRSARRIHDAHSGKDEIRAYYKEHGGRILAALAAGDAARESRQYAQARAQYQEVIDRIAGAPAVTGQMRKVREQAEAGLVTVARLRERTETASKELTRSLAKATRARDAGDLGEARKGYYQVLAFLNAQRRVLPPARAKDARAAAEAALAAVKKAIETREQEELDRQQRELAAAALARKQAEEKRRKEESDRRKRQARELRRLWAPMREIAKRIQIEAVLPGEADMAKIKALDLSLGRQLASLPKKPTVPAEQALRESCRKMLTSVARYHKALVDFTGGAERTVGAREGSRVQVALRKLCRGRLGRHVVEFERAYETLLKSLESADPGASGSLSPVGTARCQRCGDTGQMPCPACIYPGKNQGKSTGKRKCTKCTGGHVQCATCGGAWGRTCTVCKGKGKILVSYRSVGSLRWPVYRKCMRTPTSPGCDGTGKTHYDLTQRTDLPGPCPTCGERSKWYRGKQKCPDCGGTGLTGACATCNGTKTVPCTFCDATKKSRGARGR